MSENLETYIARRSDEAGRRIREARSRKGWTQEQAARFLNCSRRRFNRVEQGLVELGFAEIEALAGALGVPVSFLLDGPSEIRGSGHVGMMDQRQLI